MSKTKIENSKAPNPLNFEAAADALRRGDVIVFPTETLYGLGADALNHQAVEKIFQLKGRDAKNPIPVLVDGPKMLRNVVAEIPPLARKLMDRFWPGPLTLVLPARQDLPKPLLNASGGIAVRISSQPIAMQLVQALGRPLTATSANPSGEEPARTLQEAKNYFAGKVKVFLDGGRLNSKSGSTVVEVVGDDIKIIREGDIAAFELERVLEKGKCYR
ncbi:MAG TPA: L-threonylcarbamoyladenylate synthase [Candidatus Acidoferrales bacterium]|nr:L-threonylcarbamoyladenylate synthase [Candidatus Acidoferrales bacterium]